MRITSRRKAMAFFIVLGVCLVALAIALNVGWIILNLRQGIMLFLGVIFFAAIILGMILNTGFLVRELRRNEQHDSFLNAVTHELKTPIASIRLYLETLQHRDVDEAQRRHFYNLMLTDTDRLLGTVEQVLKASQVSNKPKVRVRAEVDLGNLARECMELARTRHRLAAGRAALQGIRERNPATCPRRSRSLRTAVSNLLDNAIKYSRERSECYRRGGDHRRKECPASRSRSRRGNSGGRTQAHIQAFLSRARDERSRR